MDEDERAIRDLVSAWMEASKAGDTAALLALMTDDAVFMVPGAEPFGKQAFADAAEAMAGARLEGANEIVELRVLDDWAFLRARIDMTMVPPGGPPVRRAGYTLTILRKDDGTWRLTRDANLLTAQ